MEGGIKGTRFKEKMKLELGESGSKIYHLVWGQMCRRRRNVGQLHSSVYSRDYASGEEAHSHSLPS